jgi:ferritin-like metal-binding protein YciE
MTCEAMVALSEEANHVMEEAETGPVRDEGLIALAQPVGTDPLAACAKQMGMKDASMLHGETLKGEEAADKKLNSLGLNECRGPQAQAGG